MKAYKTTFLVAGVLVVLFGLTSKTWAGGGEASSGCTLAGNPGQGAIALRGTAAAEAHSLTFQSVKDVDLILRLTRSGVTKFFRVHDGTTEFFGLTNEDVICTFISDTTLKSNILSAFGISASWNLVLTASSISNATDPDLIPPANSRISGIADVTIYAVRP
jgi:hypothetical protein